MRTHFIVALLVVLGWRLHAAELDAVWSELEERLSESDRASLLGYRNSGKIILPPAKGTPPVEKGGPLVTFVRPYWESIASNTIPTSQEIDAPLALNAALGEREPFTVGIFPLEDQANVEVSIDALVNDKGNALPSSAWSFAETHYLPMNIGYVPHPKPDIKGDVLLVNGAYIVPGRNVTIRKGVTRQVWGFIRVPKDSTPGLYKGKLRFTRNGQELAARDIQFRIYPFELQHSGADFGWFYGPGPAMEQELAQLAEHGCNCITFPQPKVRIEAGKVVVDFSQWEQVAKACSAVGMNGRHLFYALGIARHLKLPEFSENHARYYTEAMRQIFEWTAKNQIKMVAWVVDEPRERDINPWNRNYDETLKYLKLYKDVPDAVTMVSPMRDVQNGKNYTGMVAEMDLLYTHPWEASKKLIDEANRLNKPFISYNSTRERFSFGFGTWSIGAQGRWQWHYINDKDAFLLSSFAERRAGWGRVAFTTKDGPFASPILEITSEGVDDFWYVRTLESAMKQAAEKPELRAALDEAKQVMAALRANVPTYVDAGALKNGADATGDLSNPYERSRTSENLRRSIARAIAALNKSPID
jgi:hypothetical protein